ncbi:unnamed protein product [Effrenium voratum]|nr:unnamed protein product [Effrenium voratum]
MLDTNEHHVQGYAEETGPSNEGLFIVIPGLRTGRRGLKVMKSDKSPDDLDATCSRAAQDFVLRMSHAAIEEVVRVINARSKGAAQTLACPLQILVNNAGTTQGCSLTQDKIESAFQVNYLSHFLLTNGLMPALRGRPARVVHVTCQEGYLRPARGWSHRFGEGVLQGWLGTPVPIQEGVRVGSMRITSGRTPGSSHEVEDSAEAATLREDIEWRVDRCKVAEAYSNAKLAVLAFSRELGRRGISSHAINPNALLTDFKPLVAERSSSMSYFPPVWITGKVFGFLGNRLRKITTRSVEHGAKGVLHVASLKALERSRSGLFDDTETAFTKCGKEAALCGRVPDAWLPPVVLDEQATSELWKISSELVGLEKECEGDVCEM